MFSNNSVLFQDAGEMVRSFVGGLELIVSLLKSDDREVGIYHLLPNWLYFSTSGSLLHDHCLLTSWRNYSY